MERYRVKSTSNIEKEGKRKEGHGGKKSRNSSSYSCMNISKNACADDVKYIMSRGEQKVEEKIGRIAKRYWQHARKEGKKR
jgi:hypothetical protein